MAIVKVQNVTSTLVKTTENGPTTLSRVKPVSRSVRNDPISGGFITFPDGSRFRKPTNHAVRAYSITGADPQVFRGEYRGVNAKPKSTRNVDTSPGGYTDDDLMGANCPSFPGDAQTRLYDVPVITSLMGNEAVTKALTSIADQKANIGENLATLRQTSQLLGAPCRNLYDALKFGWKQFHPLLRDNKRSLYRHHGPLQRLADLYIKYVYGLKPLMSDVHGIMELLSEQSDRPLLLSGKGTSVRTRAGGEGVFTNPGAQTTTQWTSTKQDSVVRCQIWGRIDPNSASLRTLNQAGLANPLGLAWDLVSWSFVVDWFIPVGNVLAALTAPAGLTFVAGTKSVRSKFFGTYRSWCYSYMGSDHVRFTDSRATGTAIASGYKRETVANWPTPGFYFNSNPFSGDRSYKALALAILNLKGLRI